MGSILGIIVVIALVIVFPLLIFYLFIRSISVPGTRWWGIVLLLSLLTCYCTTIVAVVGLIVGGNATGSVALEEHYCEEFRAALAQTDDLPAAIARMDAASATLLETSTRLTAPITSPGPSTSSRFSISGMLKNRIAPA